MRTPRRLPRRFVAERAGKAFAWAVIEDMRGGMRQPGMPEPEHGRRTVVRMGRRLGASPSKRMAASWSGSDVDPTEYKVAARDYAPMAGSPRFVLMRLAKRRRCAADEAATLASAGREQTRTADSRPAPDSRRTSPRRR